ncbi:hypothetical protein RK21_01085 [Pseudomonas plecoglossicida]|nr:hypothetical protein RK21_01085 [Pseudomonas plecoglossicida]
MIDGESAKPVKVARLGIVDVAGRNIKVSIAFFGNCEL